VKKTKKATIKPGAFLADSDVYGYLAANKMSFDQLIGEDTDYKALAGRRMRSAQQVCKPLSLDKLCKAYSSKLGRMLRRSDGISDRSTSNGF
jgi:hypothetical protein